MITDNKIVVALAVISISIIKQLQSFVWVSAVIIYLMQQQAQTKTSNSGIQ